MKRIDLDGIPVGYVKPENLEGIALWIPYLGGSIDSCEKILVSLAERNFAAVSLDPWKHGERSGSSRSDIRTDALKSFRKVMWQVLGLTVLDCFKVIDWASEEFDLSGNIVAGGLSMGGDIAISLAGIDKRIKRVAGVASSPDWYRSGMTDVMDGAKVIDQGSAGPYSQWLCDNLNPFSNIERYNKAVIHLEYGKKDTHIHSDWAIDFRNKAIQSGSGEASIEILNERDSDHIQLVEDQTVIKRAIDFLCLQ